MSLAHAAAEYMLSDALLPDRRGPRLQGLRLELPLDRMVKFVAVGFPLLLMSLAFAQEFSAGKWLPGLRSKGVQTSFSKVSGRNSLVFLSGAEALGCLGFNPALPVPQSPWSLLPACH